MTEELRTFSRSNEREETGYAPGFIALVNHSPVHFRSGTSLITLFSDVAPNLLVNQASTKPKGGSLATSRPMKRQRQMSGLQGPRSGQRVIYLHSSLMTLAFLNSSSLQDTGGSQSQADFQGVHCLT